MKLKKKKKKKEKKQKKKKEKEIIYKEFSTLSTLNTNENAFLFVFIPSLLLFESLFTRAYLTPQELTPFKICHICCCHFNILIFSPIYQCSLC